MGLRIYNDDDVIHSLGSKESKKEVSYGYVCQIMDKVFLYLTKKNESVVINLLFNCLPNQIQSKISDRKLGSFVTFARVRIS